MPAAELVSLAGGWIAHVTAPGASSPPHPISGVPVTLPAHLESQLRAADLDASDIWLRHTLSLSSAASARLLFGAVGPLADVFVDGELRLAAHNMFRDYELALELSAGAHEIAFCLRSPARALSARRPRPRWRTRLVAQQQLRFLRMSFLGRMPGWSNTQPPRGVYALPRLLRTGTVDASDLHVQVEYANGRGTVIGTLPAGAEFTEAALHVGSARSAFARSANGSAAARVELERPALWWPHTHGTPALHAVDVAVDGTAFHSSAVGFRSVAAGSDSHRFSLRINDVPVFCRGAVFVPQCWDLDFSSTRAALEALKRAGGNMVRIAGTMRYEDQAFFDACNELGILVWQDFMLSALDYPADDENFRAELGAEVDQQLRRWQRHASVAVLCGGSEVAQQAAMVGQPPERWYGALFDTFLPERCAALLPGVPYVPGSPSSPMSGDGPDAPPPMPFRNDLGVAHYFGVGAYLEPFADARRADVTFASECLGFANVPEPETVEALFGDDVAALHTPRWKAAVPRDHGTSWDFEDVRDHYYRGLFGRDPMLDRYADIEGYLERSRIVSAEVMTRVFAEWRRAGSRTNGGIVWFLRDLVPGAGWGLLDSAGREKAPLFALQRAWAPTAVAFTDERVNGLRVHVIHDGEMERRFTLRLAAYKSGALVAEAARDVVARPREAQAYSADGIFESFHDLGWAFRFGPPPNDVVFATLEEGGVRIAEATHFASIPAEPADAGLSAETLRNADGTVRVRVHAAAMALFVCARVPGWRPSAGYFHLTPGTSRDIILEPRTSGASAPRGAVHAFGAAPIRISCE